MSQYKQSWSRKMVNKAANLLGVTVLPKRFAAGFNSIVTLFGNSVVWGSWNEVDFVEKGYMRNATLYAIINRIIKTAATAPFKVYRIKDKKKHLKIKNWTGANATKESLQRAMLYKELAYEEDSNHPLNGLIENPNPHEGGQAFTVSCIGFKLLTGNRMILQTVLDAGANAGKVASVINLPPQHTSVKGDGTLWGVSAYVLNVGVPMEIPAEFVVHSKYWNPNITATGDHLKGLSPLTAGKRLMDITDIGEQRTLNNLTNAGANGLVFNKTIDGLDVTQAAALKQKLNEEVLGISNTGKIALANGDMGYLDFSKSFADQGVLEEKKYAKQELCNIYMVPYVLVSSENSTYNNIQEAKKELITMAVVPELASLRDDWNEIAKRYGQEDIYIDYDLSVYPEMQEDLEKTVKVMQGAWWIKGNEKRIAMGYDEDQEEEMLGRYLVPNSLADISQLNLAVIEQQMESVDQELARRQQQPIKEEA